MARSVRTHKQWSGTSNPQPIVLSTTTSEILSFSTDFSETLLRSRGELIVCAVPNAANDNEMACFGFAVVSDEARAVGTTSLPNPVSSPDFDWFWYGYAPLMDTVSTGSDASSIGLTYRLTIDSKAMRRVSPNHSLVLIGALTTGEMATCSVIAGVRILSSI